MSEGSDPILVNDVTFEAEVIRSRLPVVVDFFADWSVPSRATEPVLRELSQRLAGRVKFTKVNVDESSAVAGSYGIHSIPTILFVHDGQEKGREVGPVNALELRSILKRHFSVEDRARGGRAPPTGGARR